MSPGLGAAGRATSSSARAALGGWFAQPAAAIRPATGGCSPDILRFYRDARARLDAGARVGDDARATTSTSCGSGAAFRDHFLVPITSAVWSTASDRVLDFPLDYLLRFLDHHGLIGVGRALQWRTITGGSMAYVDRILERLGRGRGPRRRPGRRRRTERRTASPCGRPAGTQRHVRRGRHGDPRRRCARAAPRRRCHASAAPSAASSTRRTGSSSTPIERCCRAGRPRWASWNVDQADCRRPGDALSMTYHMNRLQALPGPVQYCVSVNPDERLDPARIVVGPRRCATRCTRSRRSTRRRRVGDAPGLAADVVRGRAPRLRLPRGRLSIRVRGRGASSRRATTLAATRSGRHEVAPPRRAWSAIAGRGRSSTPSSTRVYYLALDLDELDEVDAVARG